jgi:hypothetical protein
MSVWANFAGRCDRVIDMTAIKWIHATLGAVVGMTTILWAPQTLAESLELSFPVTCKLGVNCFVQNYVDIDPSTGVMDFSCGSATYDGHKGTDIRLLSTRHSRANVAVLAAAPGTVKALRNGMPDRLVGRGVSAPSGRECGNGLVIDHGGGWETQYCHLRKGSVAVRRGQRVARGARLGSVGYSGKAQFAHLHLSVRKNGEVIDPYLNSKVGSSCQRRPREGLWMAGTARPATSGVLIQAGFVDRPVDSRTAETGQIQDIRVSATSRALVFYARYINLRTGDSIRLSIRGPAGFRADSKIDPLTRSKAQYIAFVGKKLKTARWPRGRYQAQVGLVRNEQHVRTQEFHIDLP